MPPSGAECERGVPVIDGAEGRRPVAVRFDGEIFRLQQHGGISRYFGELVRAFVAGADAVTPSVPAAARTHATLRSLALDDIQPSGPPAVRHLTFYGQRSLTAARLNRRLHPGSRVAVTVHDMMPELFPQWFPGRSPHLAKRAHIRAADVVLCVSDRTRTDLLEAVPVDPARVFVTTLAPSSRIAAGPSVRKRQRTLLFVGRRDGYKDFATAVRALAHLRQRDVAIVAAGGGPFTTEELALHRQLGVHDQVSQVSPDDAALARLYRSSTCLVVPSWYEGFGLPAVEAMSCGTPVVLARAGALPEVGGDAAEYFPPRDDEALADRFARLLGDPTYWSRRAAASAARATAFSWGRTATSTARAYRAALDA